MAAAVLSAAVLSPRAAKGEWVERKMLELTGAEGYCACALLVLVQSESAALQLRHARYAALEETRYVYAHAIPTSLRCRRRKRACVT